MNTLTCVYCGKEYPAGTPASGADVKALADHIKTCEKHPLRKAEATATIKKLRAALVALVGSNDKTELEGMEAMTRSMLPPGNKDGDAMINAIRILIETASEEGHFVFLRRG